MTYPRYSNHFTPFDTMRPVPSEADKADAERIIAEHGPCSDPEKRAERVEAMARIVMQKRIETDWRTTIAVRVIHAFAIGAMFDARSDQPIESKMEEAA